VQHKVVVVVHQAIGQNLGIKSRYAVGQHIEQGLPIDIILKDRLTTVTTRSHVVDGAWKFNAKGSGHDGG
jgi:hypothetical protein